MYAPTKIYGFSWKFKNFIVGAMMMVTYPIRLPFRVIARIFRMFFVAKSKSKSVAVAPKKVGIEAIESSAESSKASKQSVVLAAVSNENKEAGQALLERAGLMFIHIYICLYSTYIIDWPPLTFHPLPHIAGHRGHATQKSALPHSTVGHRCLHSLCHSACHRGHVITKSGFFPPSLATAN